MMLEVLESSLKYVDVSLELYYMLETRGSSLALQRLRYDIVSFMIEISTYTSPAKIAKGTAIHIFDSYLKRLLKDDTEPSSIDNSCNHFKRIAFVCYILSIKINISYTGFLDDFMKKFSQITDIEISKKDISELECIIMNAIDFDISPQSPATHIYRLIFDQTFKTMPSNYRKDFCNNVEASIDECSKDVSYLRYSPTTISIASFVYSCSVMQLDCSHIIANIPDICFRVRPPASAASVRALDVSACVDAISVSMARPSIPPAHIAYTMSSESPASSPRKSFAPRDVMHLSREISEAVLVAHPGVDTKRRRLGSAASIAGLTIESRKFSLTGLLDTIIRSVAICESTAPSQPIKESSTESSCEDDLSVIDIDDVETYES